VGQEGTNAGGLCGGPDSARPDLGFV